MKKRARKQLVRFIVNSVGSFICCSLILGISMLLFFHGLNMTEEMMKEKEQNTLQREKNGRVGVKINDRENKRTNVPFKRLITE